MILERGTRPIPDNSFREATLAQAGIIKGESKKKSATGDVALKHIPPKEDYCYSAYQYV